MGRMDLHLFGKRSVKDVYADLLEIGFQPKPDLKWCTFGTLLVTPKGQETGFLTSRQLPPGSGNMFTVFAMCPEEANLLKTIEGYEGIILDEEEEA